MLIDFLALTLMISTNKTESEKLIGSSRDAIVMS